MKTTLQELKEEILDLRFDAHVNGLDEFKNALNQVIVRIDRKIAKEKKIIMDACIHGAENEYGFGEEQAEEYYTKTFDDAKKELQARIDVIKELAKKSPKSPKDSTTTSEDSLSKVIRNQKEADDFMRQLHSLAKDPAPYPEFWTGWIESFNEDEIYCLLRKDYSLDKELELGRGLLTPEQDAMVANGLCIRFDIANNKIQFMLPNLDWC